MGTVGRAERVVDKDVGHACQFAGKRRIVLRLFLVEADVLEQHDVTFLERRGLGLGVLADDVGGQRDRTAE